MPRRNRPKRRRPFTTEAPAPTPIGSTDRMALELVRTGKASAAILGSHLPPTRTTEGNENDG